ncbi:DNA-deoxyinosine glycosylase [Thauera sp. JM12B12]|uniref:DNA-deoxyinosine glycosylase n=1 Tax=Thauera sp. JM12B12 TaxID=3142262 RepID=UPI0031F34FD6
MSTTAAPLVRSFAPLFRADARVLVLGSMPGATSQAAGEYYAQPRNAFWQIMSALFGAGPELPYAQRLERLAAAGVALWDVISYCERAGSKDNAIIPASVKVNDFAGLLHDCPQIRHIFFNGTFAEKVFRRHVLNRVASRELFLTRLPSTSPTYASLHFDAKLAAWQAVRAAVTLDSAAH